MKASNGQRRLSDMKRSSPKSFNLSSDSSSSQSSVVASQIYRHINRKMRKAADVQKEEELMNLCYYSKRLDEKKFARFCELVRDQSVNINYVDLNHQTPLLLICYKQKTDQLQDCVKVLLERPDLDVHVRDTGICWNAFGMACRHHPSSSLLRVLRLLLEKEIDVTVTAENGDNALMVLCANYNNDDLIDIVQLLVQNGIDLNLADATFGWNCLIFLLFNYHGENLFEIVRFLLEHDCKVNMEGNRNDNALTAACASYKHKSLIEIVRLLIQHKININWINPALHYNALVTLCYSGYRDDNLMDIVRTLLEAGIDVNFADPFGWNCLFALAKNLRNGDLHRDFKDIVRLLIEKEIDINHKTTCDYLQLSSGSNLAHILCKFVVVENDLMEMIRFLKVETKLDFKIKDTKGNTPVDLVKKRKFKNEHLKNQIIAEIEDK